MKRARITCLIAVPAAALVPAGCTAATAKAIAGTGESAADQVRTAERTLLRAAVDGDTRTAGALLAPTHACRTGRRREQPPAPRPADRSRPDPAMPPDTSSSVPRRSAPSFDYCRTLIF